MYKARFFLNLIVILALVLVTLGISPTTAQAGPGKEKLKADPRLLQMAIENPDAVFMVIVQKEAKNKRQNDDDPEVAVKKGGGQVGKQLDLILSFSAEMTGREIIKLARNPNVRWISADAPMVSADTPGMDNVLDQFTTMSYVNNNGSKDWSNGWVEGDGHGDANISTPDAGMFLVSNSVHCSGGSGYCLRVDPYAMGSYVYREANLAGAASAMLSFHRNNRLLKDYGEVALEISGDGGVTWATLRKYSRTQFTGSATDSFDITAYASANTRVRFRTVRKQSGFYYIFFDDIKIDYAIASVFLSTIKADQLNLNGSGITVAVVDSGIAYHNDFKVSGSNNKYRIIANEYFSGSGGSDDLYGHGTHVAGTIGGNGFMSDGKYRGVAPGINLINLKVTDKDGMTYESTVVNSLQWIYNNKDVYNIRVVNISLNSTVAQSYHTSPLSAAVEILWFNGIVVVVSAGNNGTADGPSTVYPPANDPFVITVGASEDKGTASLADDTLAVFSAYGVTEDGYAKPEIVAPGRNIVAPLAQKASTVYTAHPLHRVGDYYFRMSGTSMSAPVVSGAVALLLQDEPHLTPDQVKYRLTASANAGWAGYLPSQSGAGCLDAEAAVNGSTTESANSGIVVSMMLTTGSDPVVWDSVGWNSVGWNSVGWNSVGWNSVGWNSVGWNSVGWNTSIWDD